MEKHELRAITLGSELRVSGDGSSLSGYAARFDSEADLGDFVENIDPHAFDETLGDNDDIVMLQNHDPNFVLGRTKSNTLTLGTDHNGLLFRCDLSSRSPIAQSVAESVRRGDISGCSFGFLARKDAWNGNRRTLLNVRLFDVSAAVFPAYGSTSILARSFRAQSLNAKNFGTYKLPAPVPVSEEERERMELRFRLAKLL
jgi:HK97 family phage prohead protease